VLNKIIFISILFFAQNTLFAEYVPGEVLVKVKKSSNISSYARVSEISGSELKIVKIDKSKNIMSAIEELAQNPDIEYAQPNYIYHISIVPNDTRYSDLWGLKNTGQTVTAATYVPTHGNAGDDINAENAWGIITDCSSITVAVIDTGVNYTHDDLKNNMWDGGSSYPKHGWDFYNSDNDPVDDNGHGSHLAGIIGAQGNNSIGVTGVCWLTNIMALKSFDSSGTGSTATIISAISFAINNGANIINASFNLYGSADTALSATVTAAEQADILIVSAAGNGYENDGHAYNVDSGTKTYPCCFTQDNVLCIAALDQKFQIASFSNYGATSVDVAAPGTNVVSTWYTTNSTYYLENGTSMATPYAAGLAALVWANNPSYTYLDVKNAVIYGGAAVSSMSGITVSGNVINAYNALNYINVPRGLAAVVAK